MCENCFSRKIYKTENLNFAMCILLKKNTFLVNIFFFFLKILSHQVECNMGNIFQVSHIFKFI